MYEVIKDGKRMTCDRDQLALLKERGWRLVTRDDELIKKQTKKQAAEDLLK